MEIPDISSLNCNTIREKYIKSHYPEFYNHLIERYKTIKRKNLSELLYLFYHNMSEPPKCPVCGNSVQFINISLGYQKNCSYQCAQHNPKTKEKIKQTCLKKYGVENYSQYKDYKEKIKQTCLKKYGVEFYASTKECKERHIKTCLEKYGVDNYAKTDECKDKTKQTNLERYGVDNYTKTDECKNKTKQTNLERYGVDYYSKTKEYKEKCKQSCLIKYGETHYNKTNECKNRIKQTCLEKYGVENPSKSDEVKEKIKQTCLEKYGVENPSSIIEIKNRVKQTCLQKYGKENYTQTDEYKIFIKENSPKIQKKIYETRKRNNSFRSSKIEKQFEQWLMCNKINYIKEYKCKEYPFKCDFYFPDKNLYLEIQGFWSHGGHPFDSNNKDDIEKANCWKEKGSKLYLNNYNVWAVRDPLKRQWAKDHNLNWIEVFTSDVNILIDKIKDLLL